MMGSFPGSKTKEKKKCLGILPNTETALRGSRGRKSVADWHSKVPADKQIDSLSTGSSLMTQTGCGTDPRKGS